MHQTIITWSYFKIYHKSIYFGWRWKKNAYLDTLNFTQIALNRDLDKFIKTKRYLDIFNFTDEEKEKLSRWNIHIEIPKYKDVIINRNFLKKKWFKKTYVIECKLNCKVTVKVW